MTLADNGMGITPETLPHVFEPIVQDPYTVGLGGVGVGIGLTARCARLSTRMGGVVARSAGRGLGSEFIVALPRVAGRQ